MPHPVEAPIRKLLLIYIHGFMGNETSFQSFPTHVHEALVSSLSSTHTIKTIVYPKFKTRKKIDFARDDLVGWLQQFSSKETDIILLGHSMGGLLAADVALLAAGQDEGNRTALEHGILGVVGLDTPFLGMHPRIILSGLGSLFTRNSTETDLVNESGQSVNLESPTNGELDDVLPCPISPNPIPTDAIDENPALSSHSEYPTKFSPPPSITSKSKQSPWSRAFNFINKHSDDLTKASKAYLTSHLEFGGCMADYQGLEGRYERISSPELSHERKVRFVNYYTASTGRPRKKKTQPPSAEEAKPRHSNSGLESTEEGMQEMETLDRETISYDRSRSPSTNAEKNLTTTLDSLEQHSFNHELNSVGPSALTPTSNPFPPTIPPPASQTSCPSASTSSPPSSSLPQIPPRPTPPPPINPSHHPTKASLKLASRAHAAETKTYNRAVKARDAAILARRKEAAKQAKAAPKEDSNTLSISDEQASVLPSVSPPPAESPQPPPSTPNASTSNQTPRYRPFCLLPPKNIHRERRDSSWIRITMHDVDEIGAHCGLFAAGGRHYDDFVSGVVDRIEGWVVEGKIW